MARAIGACLCALFSTVSAASGAPQTLSVGIVPQQSATELVRQWAPLLAYLEARTGYALRFETAKDIPTFERRLVDGSYDVAYMSPYTYMIAHRARAGYSAFAREKGKKLTGVVVARKDSPYRTLADLTGKTLAFPARDVIAASLLPRAHFLKQGIPIVPQYVGSHDSVYLAVAKGLYAAGGGAQRTFEVMPRQIRDQLHVLWTSPGYTPHPFAAHKKVPKDIVDRILAAMIAMEHDEAGRGHLTRIAFAGIEPAADADYDDLRALKIDDRLLK